MVVRIILVVLVIIAIVAYMIYSQILLPVSQFLTRVDSIFGMWEATMKEILEEVKPVENVLELTAGNFKFRFASTREASIEFEKCIKETLAYYEELGVILEIFPDLESDKEKLYRLATEVRRLRLSYKD